MPEAKAKEIADESDLIVNGYAFSKCDAGIRILNLRNGKAALVIGGHQVSETNMDDLDLALALRYLSENEQFMELTETGSAKFFVKSDGDTSVAERGRLNDREISGIQAFIKLHYHEMYLRWAEMSDSGFYKGI